MASLEFELNIFPPSLNQLYSTNRYGKRVLSKVGIDFKTTCDVLIRIKNLNSIGLRNNKLKLELDFFYPWLTKKKKIAKADLSNRIKVIEDAIFKALGLDDSLVFVIVCNKVTVLNKSECKVLVKISTI